MNEIAECVEQNVDEIREEIIKMVAGIPVEIDLFRGIILELKMYGSCEKMSTE
ncbi:hypothetical protein [Roseburia sp. 1XD42-69]|jgi:hypothetical protein|uniref:hypothetical protein n=1 Tax=Roseburia sp. 1XD42-69 TaxID=2320088 RepID=UPI001314CF38|nr:hypothetical protein [Roseburia sp. 1XD42-69]MCX4319058.1 hypothetical protein [Lachnospiraceae bacterium]